MQLTNKILQTLKLPIGQSGNSDKSKKKTVHAAGTNDAKASNKKRKINKNRNLHLRPSPRDAVMQVRAITSTQMIFILELE